MLTVIAALLPSTANAFTLVISSDLKGWDASILPIHYNPADCSVSPARLEAAIDRAVALWNSVPMSSLRLRRGRVSSSSAGNFNSPTIAIFDSPVVLCSMNFGMESGLAETGTEGIDDLVPALVRPAAQEGRLIYAPMLLNSSGGAADIAGFTDEKLAIIIAHEIGHMLGLGHVSDPASLMYFNVSEKELLALSRDDAEGVTYLYPRQEPFAGEFMGCGTLGVGSGPSSGLWPRSDSGLWPGSRSNGSAAAGEALRAFREIGSGGSLLSWLMLLLSCFLISRLRFSEPSSRADPI